MRVNNKEWAFFLLIPLAILVIAYYRLDVSNVAWYGLRTLVIVTVLVFTLKYIVTKLYKVYNYLKTKLTRRPKATTKDGSKNDYYDSQTNRMRQESQNKFTRQAVDYQERILIPREETRRAKEDEKLERILGPVWKGRGEPLGGEAPVSAQGEGSTSDGQEAARVRQLREPETVAVPPVTRRSTKRVIELPEEPPEGSPTCVTIILRTPIGTSNQRRFDGSCPLQDVLNYMTTIGFNQGAYTLSTSYPRRTLSGDADKTLAELGFEARVILNIEEAESTSTIYR